MRNARMLRTDFAAGARTVAPVLIGILPFALIAGMVAVRLGLSPWVASGLSLFVFAGARLPDAWQLEFAVPLVFLAMIVPSLRDKANVAAAAVGGIVALAGHTLPWNLGLILGALAGIASGVAVAGFSVGKGGAHG